MILRLFTTPLCMFLVFFSLQNAYAITPQQQFFLRLKPIAEKENSRILKQRAFVLTQKKALTRQEGQAQLQPSALKSLAKRYEMNDFKVNSQSVDALLSRIDIIPMSLLLAQAADESAWGRSRFAKLGHNLFGQWCFSKGCGIVPKKRPKNARYEVKRFSSDKSAIQSYMKNLNTGQVYNQFRRLRANLRKNNQKILGIKLAVGLQHYSTRGNRYVNDIQHIISRYQLAKYDI